MKPLVFSKDFRRISFSQPLNFMSGHKFPKAKQKIRIVFLRF